MRFNKARFALALTLLSVVALSTRALAGGWFSDEEQDVTLEELLRNPEKYKGKRVVFTVYFNEIAEEFNPYFTEFHSDMYCNFTAWPIDSRLYEKRDFQRCYPHFYINMRAEGWDDVKDLERFDVVECVGIVKHIFHGRPHIDIIEGDKVSYGLDGDQIKAAIRANAHYLAGNFDRAEKLYVRALSAKVPGPVRADLNRRLGDARYGAKRYDSARSAYKRALKDAPKSELLKRNVAACSQAHARANGSTAAQIQPTKTLAHHLEPIGDGTANGVDAVITALEDSESVEAQTAQERLELARRSVHGANTPAVVAVSNTEATEEAAEEPMEASAESESEEPKAEEMTEEPAPEEAGNEEIVEVVEEPKADETIVDEPKTEEPAPEEESTEETVEVAEEPQADETIVDEPKTEEPAPEEESTEETVEIAEEPKAEEAVEATEDEPVEAVEDAAGEESMDEEPVEPNAGPEDKAPAAPDENDPRVMKVGDTVTMLPRLPFHGCAGVSYEAFRAVVEEILDTEDPLEVAGFESEIEVSEDESAEPEITVEPVDEPAPASEEEEVPAEEQGEPGESDEPVADPEQPEQPAENPGNESVPEKFDDE